AWCPLEQAFVLNGNGTVLWMSCQQVGTNFFVDRILAMGVAAFVHGRAVAIDDVRPSYGLCPDSDLLQAEIVLQPGKTYFGRVEENRNRFLALLKGNLLSIGRNPPKSPGTGEFPEGVMANQLFAFYA